MPLRGPLLACLFASWLLAARTLDAADPAPLDRAHAHNDYLHERPLLDALDLGYCSIEADVWVAGDELLIGHSLPELRPGRTLKSLYLEPLAKRCAERGGWVFDPGRTVILLVDFKTGGDETYPVLSKQLAEHRQLFEPRDLGDGRPAVRPVFAVLSGNRPIELVEADADRLCGIDGRLPDIHSTKGANLIPLVSEAWPTQFRWEGAGPMPIAEREKLRRLADETHANGRRLRFWGAPSTEAAWIELHNAGVDLIGADDLPKLQQFLAARDLQAQQPQ